LSEKDGNMSKLNSSIRACGIFLLWSAAAVALPAQTFTTLHSFNNTDGAHSRAGLVQAINGDLYGTAYGGGADDYGTVFKITQNGHLTMLHSFDGTDGFYPDAGLVQGTDGKFYGTTSYGGTSSYGTAFKITASGTLATIYNFCSQNNCTDGSTPAAGLVHGTNGGFYGTTEGGGANGSGTVFKITPSGTLTTLYSFCSHANCDDGYLPVAGLVQGTDGKFYGTTGGNGTKGDGTVFSITPSGTLRTLYRFCSQINCTDGAFPAAGLVLGTDGNLYGTTSGGGANGNYGTVFKITPSGMLTALYSFCSQPNCTDGTAPTATLVQATDGNFYGTTQRGGANGAAGYGTAFSITPSGTLVTLYTFCSQTNCTDGSHPVAGLVQDTDGSFYGTTQNGGSSGGYGTVFSLSVGLSPFVETLPASGKVGAAVNILGTNLTSATSVTFNGTPATFTVVSASEITTTVPTGATTGTVKVVTPGGTLSSNVNFTVN